MRTLYFPILKTIYKKKEAKICMVFCILPMMLIITSLLPTNFMQLSGDVGSMACLEFFEAVIYVQYQLTLPSIAFMYLAITCVHDEITSGRLYLYRDISRKKIFLCKALGLLTWYVVYVVGTFVASVFTYYVYVIRQPYASGLFVPTESGDAQYIVISLLGTLLTFAISLLLMVVVSTFLNNGASLIVGILFVLFSFIAPSLDKINYLFPTGFLNVFEKIGFGKSVVFIFVIAGVYLCIIGLVGNYKVKRIEF